MILLARKIDHARPRATAGKTDIGHQRLTGAIDHAADDRQRNRGLDVLKPLFQNLDGLDHVKALARAGGAGNDLHATGAKAQRLQNLEPDFHLFHRVSRKRHTDRIANAEPQKAAQTNGRFHSSGNQPPRLGDAQMDRGIGDGGELLVGSGRHEDVRGFHADLKLVKVVVLQKLDVIEPGFHHRIRARLAIFVQEVLFQRPGIYPDADGAAVIFRGLHHLGHALSVADVAGVDPQTGSASLGGFNRALIVEMDVGHDRHRAFAANLAQRRG